MSYHQKDTIQAYSKLANAEDAWWEWRVARGKSVALCLVAIVFNLIGILKVSNDSVIVGISALFLGLVSVIGAVLDRPTTLKHIVQCDLINAQNEYDALASRDLRDHFPNLEEWS